MGNQHFTTSFLLQASGAMPSLCSCDARFEVLISVLQAGMLFPLRTFLSLSASASARPLRKHWGHAECREPCQKKKKLLSLLLMSRIFRYALKKGFWSALTAKPRGGSGVSHQPQPDAGQVPSEPPLYVPTPGSLHALVQILQSIPAVSLSLSLSLSLGLVSRPERHDCWRLFLSLAARFAKGFDGQCATHRPVNCHLSHLTSLAASFHRSSLLM